MERERQRLLEESAEANAEQVAALERDMNERVRELARAQSRAFLEPRPEGVPLAALDLDADEQFTAMERERQRLLEESAEANAEQVAALERDMNERVRELASAQSRAFLEPRPGACRWLRWTLTRTSSSLRWSASGSACWRRARRRMRSRWLRWSAT
ncbi:hypothetical protein ERJ75_000211300 [Trypanosoma vivax]|nr:hypothetical protein ERJ75_000211300 [Trypanosoma vivax]